MRGPCRTCAGSSPQTRYKHPGGGSWVRLSADNVSDFEWLRAKGRRNDGTLRSATAGIPLSGPARLFGPPPVGSVTATHPSPADTANVDAASAFRIVAIRFDRLALSDASAFFISADGLAVTCAHAVAGDATPPEAVLVDGRRARINVLVADPEADLALLRIEADGPFPFIRVLDRDPTQREPLATVTQEGVGHVTYLGEVIDAHTGDALAFATGLGPGASGGAIVDAAGQLIGIIRGGVDGDDAETVAVPPVRLRALLERHWDELNDREL